ncbi:hypothetical protein CLS_10000 [[Clostridium] cf. saccharolyticum K10]|nr:hypothetical protein CLS_10000 [[Clostridium] cf. saccharolyticum K10]
MKTGGAGESKKKTGKSEGIRAETAEAEVQNGYDCIQAGTVKAGAANTDTVLKEHRI